jgi:hypothetical protein
MAIAQLVIMKNNLSAFALNEKIPLLERLQNSIVFFMGFQGAWINYFWRTSTDVTVALGLFLTLLALALAKKSRGYNRIGILGILLTIYSIVVIESFAVTNTFGSGNFAIFSTNLSLNRYTIPIFHLQIILICILFSGAPLRVTRIVWRNKELAQGMKMPMIVIFSLSLLILNSEIPRSGFPLTGNSRWVKLSEKINTGKPVCIPIDPIGWYYSQGCSLLYPLGAFQGFLGFEKQGLLKGKEFKIPVPREVNGKNLILITILVKPTTDLKAEIEAQLTYTLETGEQSVIHGHQIIGGSGGQLEFVLPSAIMLKNNSILQLSFSESVVVGNNQFSGTANSGAMYYGY